MKAHKLFLALASAAMFSSVAAQSTHTQTMSSSSSATVESDDCLVNISLMNESAKNKQYAEALAPWNAAYKDCPGAQKAIYQRGRDILHWELGELKVKGDMMTYQTELQKLMGMYDNRIKYFGDDSKYPTAWILGIKGLDYYSLAINDNLKKPAYEYLEQSIDGLGDKSEMQVLDVYLYISLGLYKADASHQSKYIADYQKVGKIYEAIAKDATSPDAAAAAELKNKSDVMFAQSGAADCATLDKLFAAQVNANLTNAEYLNTTIALYRSVGCTESEVYFAAAVAAHKIQPTVESARACAAMSYKKGEFQQSIDFYSEAIKISADENEKADLYYTIAQIYYKEINSYARSREYARKSLDINPNNGKAYVLIGTMYAKSTNIYDDPVLAKTIYWVAVDKFIKARSVDSSVADAANELIRSYTPHFPTKEEIFMQPELQSGKSFTVGGWIGETTTCR